MPFPKILLCVDGEAHTETALSLALDLAKAQDAHIDGLYAVDPFLKKFTHEIYAVNRDECRAHLDRSLEAEGQSALDAFAARASQVGVAAGCLLRHGPPEEIIPEIAAQGGYSLVVLGGKRFAGRFDRWTSRDLPGRLDGKLPVPLLLARV